jgi:hypothetical protein
MHDRFQIKEWKDKIPTMGNHIAAQITWLSICMIHIAGNGDLKEILSLRDIFENRTMRSQIGDFKITHEIDQTRVHFIPKELNDTKGWQANMSLDKVMQLLEHGSSPRLPDIDNSINPEELIRSTLFYADQLFNEETREIYHQITAKKYRYYCSVIWRGAVEAAKILHSQLNEKYDISKDLLSKLWKLANKDSELDLRWGDPSNWHIDKDALYELLDYVNNTMMQYNDQSNLNVNITLRAIQALLFIIRRAIVIEGGISNLWADRDTWCWIGAESG